MRIDRLTLLNFRRFQTLSLQLHPRLTVLAGVNGSGKSSALEGLALASGALLLGFDDVPAPGIRREHVRRQQHSLGDQPTIEPQYPVEVTATGSVGPESQLVWTRSLTHEGGRTTQREAQHLKAIAQSLQVHVRGGVARDLPVIAYYGPGRLWSQKRASATKRKQLGSRLLAYTDCLEPASNQKLFEAWMRRLEGARIQEIAAASAEGALPADTARPPALDAVQRAAAQMVPGAERLYYDIAHDELRLLYTNGQRMPFDLLSDGYRNLIAMVADVAWRAVQLNPHLRAAATQQTPGVVLIDEIELHLHPGWQREVLDRLTTTFPAMQFVVTTHAPAVISATPAESLRFLADDGRVHHVATSRGLTADAVLRHLMGVPARPDDEARRIAHLGALLEAGRTSEARQAFDALNAQLGGLDPELATLEWELRDLEVNGALD